MKILIYGSGRMGKTFRRILNNYYVKIYSRDPKKSEVSEQDIGRFDVVILCIPERAYKEALRNISRRSLVVDISSIKEKTLPLLRESGHRYLSIHPLFGNNIYPYFSEIAYVESNCKEAEDFIKVLEDAGMRVVHTNAHDREMARIQGVPHFVLLAMSEYFKDTKAKTALLKALLALAGRVRSQNPEVILRIQDVSKKEKERFIRFLREFDEKLKDNFSDYFGVDEDFSFILNATKLYEKPRTIEEYRNYIEVVDNLILDLLKMRENVSRNLALLKKEKNIPVEIKEVEERKLNRLLRDVRNPILVEQIFARIFKLSKEVQYEVLGIRNLIGVLGPQGSYSERMGLKLVGNRTFLKYYPSISDVFAAVEKREVSYGIVPIENSLAGSVVESLEALLKYDVFAIGESELKISHCLVAKSVLDLKEVRYVYSHPQAVMQCIGFIKKYMPDAEIIYSPSTSEALKMLDEVSVAIASEDAARMGGYTILRRDIQDRKDNVTRFYIISKDKRVESPQITSLFFSVEDRPGALKQVLDVFYEEKINLRKLESRPDMVRTGKYIFFTEAESDLDEKVIRALREKTEFIKVVGKLRRIEFLEI